MSSKSPLKAYIWRVGTVTSVWCNVVFFGGVSNQSFSAHNYEWKREGKWNLVWLIDKLLGEGHCLEYWCYWWVRRPEVVEYQQKMLYSEMQTIRGPEYYEQFFEQGDPN